MNKVIKRVIAREGLILLGIVLISSTCIFISAYFINKYPEPNYNVSDEEFLSAEGLTLEEIALTLVNKKFRDDHPEFKDVGFLELFPIIKKRFPEYIYPENALEVRQNILKKFAKIETKKKLNNIFRGINDFGYKFLLLAYPIYLLISFIFWAIRTLKHKD